MEFRVELSVVLTILNGFTHIVDTSYCEEEQTLGFALWIDEHEKVIWAQGTHEYRPMGAAVIALLGQFRPRDFRQSLQRPRKLQKQFIGFFGSLEDVNHYLRDDSRKRRPRPTPAHLL